MSPLRWTCKSVRTLAAELTRQGHPVSHQTVSEVLQQSGYSLQVNRKTREGGGHPDRNAQFEHIARRAKEFQQLGQPVISVDTKKKELVGDFKSAGREGHPNGGLELCTRSCKSYFLTALMWAVIIALIVSARPAFDLLRRIVK